jgi:thiosulfate reductase cytochrome b subunit
VRHSALVRITHWITTVSFAGLLVSGVAILLAHPRLYWGEAGAIGSPALIDLPLPFVLVGQSGWGRYLHFLAAWVCVVTGLLYVVAGLANQHFQKHLLPAKRDRSWGALWRVASGHVRSRGQQDEWLSYNVVQQLAYVAVVFVLFPVMIWTGLAMSPAITSVAPILVIVLGGQQSARTVHFFVANALLVFLILHVAMIALAGFSGRVRAMLTGYSPPGPTRI